MSVAMDTPNTMAEKLSTLPAAPDESYSEEASRIRERSPERNFFYDAAESSRESSYERVAQLGACVRRVASRQKIKEAEDDMRGDVRALREQAQDKFSGMQEELGQALENAEQVKDFATGRKTPVSPNHRLVIDTFSGRKTPCFSGSAGCLAYEYWSRTTPGSVVTPPKIISSSSSSDFFP